MTSKIKSINLLEKELEQAFPPQSVAIQLEDDIDISRGDMIVDADNVPQSDQEIDSMLCWLSEKPMLNGGKYMLKHTTKD